MTIVPGKKYTVQIRPSDRFTPREEILFTDITQAKNVSCSRRWLPVKPDGKTVFTRRMAFYDSPPWVREVGKNDISLTAGSINFSGEISNLRTFAVKCPPRQREQS